MGKCVHPGVIEAVRLGADHPRNPIAAREKIRDHRAVESLRALDHDNRRPAAFLQLQDQRGRQVIELRRVGNTQDVFFREFRQEGPQRRGLSSGRSIEEARGMHPEYSKRAAR